MPSRDQQGTDISRDLLRQIELVELAQVIEPKFQQIDTPRSPIFLQKRQILRSRYRGDD